MTKFELEFEKIINLIAESWGFYLHGNSWEKGDLKKREILTEDEHKKAVNILVAAYSDILDLCRELETTKTAFRSMVYRVAICMSEELGMKLNAYNLALTSQKTPHNAKFFREAMKRNKGLENIAPKGEIEINLDNMVREIKM